jgi:hypothetical protein
MPKNTKAGAGNTGQERTLRAAGNPSRTHSTTGPVYVQGRVVGQVRGDVFYKTVKRSIHLYRALPGWAVDVVNLDDVERRGARWVELFDKESGARYRATIAEIRRHGRLLNHKNYGRQLCLHLDGWTVTRPGEPAAEQLSLFGGGL